MRVRHRLNANLRRHGGHVGYYVRPAFRGRGLARRGLAQALDYLRELGERFALVTVDDDNFASIAVVESCGGVLEDKLELGELGVLARRYRIKLERS
ncbi:MAG: GNAT family N-acetyltransferase [Planctomycetes bacterium]|nr:GNAT family N-acetyltransferase [Planctomycetota bacterium]